MAMWDLVMLWINGCGGRVGEGYTGEVGGRENRVGFPDGIMGEDALFGAQERELKWGPVEFWKFGHDSMREREERERVCLLRLDAVRVGQSGSRVPHNPGLTSSTFCAGFCLFYGRSFQRNYVVGHTKDLL